MELDRSQWPAFHDFLFLDDHKFSTKEQSLWSYRSKFFILVDYFQQQKLPFNKQNFIQFIKEKKATVNPRSGKLYAPSYLNKFITTAKLIDSWLKFNELKEYSYFPDRGNRPKRKVIRADVAKKLAEVKIDYKKFKNYINQRQEALIKLMHTTGPRIDEALSLEWDDIDTDPYHVTYRDTKNGEDRSHPITEKMYQMLMDLPRRSKQYVFASARTGNKMRGREINDDLKARAAALGLEITIHNHLFRHSYITTMLECGAELSDVSALAGHKDPKSTMRYKNSLLTYFASIIYLHPLNQEGMDLEEIGQKLLELAYRFISKDKFKARIADHEENSLCLMLKKHITSQ